MVGRSENSEEGTDRFGEHREAMRTPLGQESTEHRERCRLAEDAGSQESAEKPLEDVEWPGERW